MAAGTCAVLRKRPRVRCCSGVCSRAAPGKERAQPELRGCGRGRRTQPGPVLPRQGQPCHAPGHGARLRGVCPGPCSLLSMGMSPGHGMACSPLAQLCHSPSCGGCNCSTSSDCCAGAVPGPSFSSRASLGMLRGLWVMSLPGFMATCGRRWLGKGPSQQVLQSFLEDCRVKT